ncbi:MAG TPA: response regulator, partial [Gemmatimonadales bacterium]|nr:response regulator [Gemmatimonadales bacterium]
MATAVSVLIVDDDAVACAQLRALVGAAGYAVSVATNGREAWEMLHLARIPVVISDWYMPEMDGPELCRRIRARQGEPYVYFVLITSRGGKQQYLAGMEAGADDFVTKPVDPDELRARLTAAERILGLRHQL